MLHRTPDNDCSCCIIDDHIGRDSGEDEDEDEGEGEGWIVGLSRGGSQPYATLWMMVTAESGGVQVVRDRECVT